MGTIPNTLSAQQNNAAMLRASQEVGYTEVGRAVGHAKSWVSRVLSCECVMSLPELLTWLDRCDLRIVPAEELEHGNSAERLEMIASILAHLDGIESAMRALEDGAPLQVALLTLARRALKDMAERG